ncbi:nuclear pore protein 84/107 [Ascodesmis nigricans]|uniref:Nuclear pore complex protein n=1 Tax=Ascodesmis nigricans TaxID=341454 RepID=A0A4S2MQY6_9PEZI|nr:nuclear pore protein 84/107 [Ascodesmis nigricans]
MAPLFPIQSPAASSQRMNQRWPQSFLGHSRNASQTSPFLQNGPSPARQQRGASIEGSWVMSDEMGSEMMGDSRLDYDQEEGEDGEFFRPETDFFAARLDNSNLLHNSAESNEEQFQLGLDLIGQYAAHAEERIEKTIEDLEQEREAGEVSEERYHQIAAEENYWRIEKQTWELFGNLLSGRLASSQDNLPELTPELRSRFSSNERIRQVLALTEPQYLELQVVIDWLRTNAPTPTEADVEAGIQRGGWIYTKEKIKSDKRKRGGSGKQLAIFNNLSSAQSRSIVKELDPDAPTRLDASLEKEDEEADETLMALVYSFIRKGDIKAAQTACEEAGQWWRAASLGGAMDAWDPKIDGETSDTMGDSMFDDDTAVNKVIGTRRRELWRRMCYALAQRTDVGEYERAVYGLLSGDIDSVVPVCRTWEDHLFAHLNSLIEGQYSTVLEGMERIPPEVLNFPHFDSVAFHTKGLSDSENESIMNRIIDTISAMKDVEDARFPLRVVQGSLVSSRFPKIVEELSSQILAFQDPDYEPDEEELEAKGLDASDNRLLRTAVHMLLVLKSMNAGFLDGHDLDIAEDVITGYIQFLGSTGRHDLVPLYAAKLTSDRAVKEVGSVLYGLHDVSIRSEILDLMYQHCLDVDGCLMEAMNKAFELNKTSYNEIVEGRNLLQNGLSGEVYVEDADMINALEWLAMGGEALRDDIVRQACEVYKMFLITGRLASAKELHERVQSKDIIRSRLDYIDVDPDNEDQGPQFQDEETETAATVFMQLEILISALMALDDWKQALKEVTRNHTQPIDRIQKDQLRPVFDRAQELLFDTTTSFLDSPLLMDMPLIPDIRNIYIPELVFALHNLYIDAGRYVHKRWFMNALELSTVVADKDKSVLAAFEESKRLTEYVDALANVSRIILGAAQEGKKQDAALGIWTVSK